MRLSLKALVASLLLLLAATPVAAQQDRPTGTPDLGSPVTIIGAEGGEIAQVTLQDLVDPFLEYDQYDPPVRGYHYVLLTVSVDNTGSRPLEVDPNDFVVVDADGYVYPHANVTLLAEANVTLLEYQEVAPGEEATGAIAFEVLNDAAMAAIVYRPESNRLISLATFAGQGPALGESVTIVGHDGYEAAQVTVSDMADPFEEYDPNSPPRRGSHYALLTVSVSNTGPRPFESNPRNFYILDSDGFLIEPIHIPRDFDQFPEMEYNSELPQGDEASGTIGFEILSGTTPIAVVYAPSSDRLITVADLSAAPSDDDMAIPVATPAASDLGTPATD